MLEFDFFGFEPLEEPSAGLTLCDLTVRGNRGTATSHGRRPNASMMLGSSVADLLMVIAAVVASETGARRELFEATASSFWLVFERSRSSVKIVQGKVVINEGSVHELIVSARRDVCELAELLLRQLDAADVTIDGLSIALERFSSAAQH
ncbi:MAG: hypothetical protein JWQ19_2148 [Subtercola sp.]|nr:hypothetical protein [Subtercola sp.]